MAKKDEFEKNKIFQKKDSGDAHAEDANIVPLSKKSLALIPDIIKLFYQIGVNVPLYPAGSEMIAQPLGELYKNLTDVLSRDSKVVFSNIRNVLFINGERLKESEIRKTKNKLKKEVSKFEKFNNVTIGRELKMRELKKEIKKLKDKA